MIIKSLGLGEQPSPPVCFPTQLYAASKNSGRHYFLKLALGTLAGWLTASLSLQANAASMLFGNGGIQFDQDVTLESKFVESHGAYQSTFGVVNLETNEKIPLVVESKSADLSGTVFRPSSTANDVGNKQDFLGTPGKVVSQPLKSFTFKAKTAYAFYLESSYNGQPTGTVYSTDVLNSEQERQAVFSSSALSDLCQGSVSVAWDDTGSKLVRDRKQQDRDFDDFVVQLHNKGCPMGGGDISPPSTVATPGPELPPAGGGRIGGPGFLGALPLLALISLGDDDGGRNRSRSSEPLLISAGDSVKPQLPHKSVPEPLTILGSSTAIGLVTLMKRNRLKKQKRQKDS